MFHLQVDVVGPLLSNANLLDHSIYDSLQWLIGAGHWTYWQLTTSLLTYSFNAEKHSISVQCWHHCFPALNFLTALIFLIAINSLTHTFVKRLFYSPSNINYLKTVPESHIFNYVTKLPSQWHPFANNPFANTRRIRELWLNGVSCHMLLSLNNNRK